MQETERVHDGSNRQVEKCGGTGTHASAPRLDGQQNIAFAFEGGKGIAKQRKEESNKIVYRLLLALPSECVDTGQEGFTIGITFLKSEERR